jgi:MinD superfamily P-loop ATPase
MREIVIVSGKGGTGKTSLTASFAYLAGKKVVVADCDVDAADLHLLLQPDFAETHEFWSGKTASIIPERCNSCGKCYDLCRFDAVILKNNTYKIDPISCEGCGLCVWNCGVNAIEFSENNCGEWYISENRFGQTMVHATLGIGEENSGKLVTVVKNNLKRIAEQDDVEIRLVDGPPGVGCPTISSLSGADLAVIVTEATVSGLHDMERIADLIEHFEIKAKMIINKYDLNKDISDKIENRANDRGIPTVGKLPYSPDFVHSLVNGKTISEYVNPQLSEMVTAIWEKILE